jgi:hypothetical protein
MMSFATPFRAVQAHQPGSPGPARRTDTHPHAGNQAALRRLSGIQAKLEVGAVDDPLEREADAVADAVIGMAAPPPLRAAAPRVSRKCAACKEEEKQTLQPKAAGSPSAVPSVAPPQVHDVVSQPGRPLDAATRGFFEPRFGLDLSAVRVHSESHAGEAARAVGARAFAVGENIVFAPNQFAPSSASGRHLLAHELAHVVQQRGGAPGRLRRAPPTKTCDAPAGPRAQPAHVSDTLIDRITGKYVKIDGDTGEGCVPTPYPASNGEKVCTIGYGHQIQDCPILDASTGAPPTSTAVNDANTVKQRDPDKPDAKPRRARPAEWLTCKCAGKAITCPDQARQILKQDVSNSGEAWVHAHVLPDLDGRKFDALVDLTLHHGSIDTSFLDEINKYYCTPEGWNYLRDVYLKQNLTPQGSTVISPGFVKRRQLRVWPVASQPAEPSQPAQPAQPPADSAPTCDPDADPDMCTEQNER